MKCPLSIACLALGMAATLSPADEPYPSFERLPFAPSRLASPDAPRSERPPLTSPFFPDEPATRPQLDADAPAEAETASPASTPAEDAPAADATAANPANAASSASPALADLQKELAALRADVKALREALAALDGRLYGRAEMKDDVGDLGRLARGVDSAQTLARDLDGRLSRAATDLRNAETLIGQNTNDIRRIRNGTAAQEDAIMDADGNLRPEVIPTRSGRLVIVNSDAAERVLYVNGTPWTARVGRSYIWVPLGNVAVNTRGAAEPHVLSEWKKNAKTGLLELEFKF